jgi:hypothetical protein
MPYTDKASNDGGYRVKLYKYMPWRPFDDQGILIENYHTRENIIKSQLYFSSAKNFNDPFDLSPGLKISSNEKDWINSFSKTLIKIEKLSYDQAMLGATEIIYKNQLTTLAGHQKMIDRMYNKLYSIGICCFTKNDPEKVLMWSHYGDQHRGLCLCFEFPDSCSNFHHNFKPIYKITSPYKVIYDSEMPIFDPLMIGPNELITLIRTKSIEWAYEEEYRMICFDHFGIVAYNPNFLKAIVAGCKMREEELKELYKSFNDNPQLPKLQVATKKSDKYGLSIIDI